jgi:predicted nucleic acid-binding protein
MVTASKCLIDTNILLRISRQNDPQHQLIGATLEELETRGTELCFTLQNIAEFWNVCTRPAERNGYGLSISETTRRVESIERAMTYLPENEHVYSIWRQLVVANSVHGVQVHDAHLVATMRAHGVTHILTLNQPDFQRYANVQAIHPSQVRA